MNKIHRLFHLISPVKALPMNAEVSFFEFFQSLLHHFVNNLLINAIALHFFLPFFSRSAKTIRNTAKTRRKITSSARIIFSFYIFISYSFHIFHFFLDIIQKICYYIWASTECERNTQKYFATAKIAKLPTSNAISNTFQIHNLIRRNISASPKILAKASMRNTNLKNTQAYFGESRMLRIGFVFDEPLRTPTYSIKFHTQAYRSGHNEAVLKTVRGNSHGGSNPSACAKKHQLFGWCFSIFCIKFVCGHNGWGAKNSW